VNQQPPDEKAEVNNTPLSAPQFKVWKDPSRFRILVAGRRFGKTYLDIAELCRAAQTGMDKNVWFIAPTYRQAKDVIWRDLMRTVPREMIAKKDETSLTLTIQPYNSRISLRGADNPDSLRGPGLDFVVFDEYKDIDPNTWSEVIRPALSDRQGEALFTGTPKGLGHFYELFTQAQARKHEGWATFQFTTLEGGLVPAAEIIAARRDMTPAKFRQEYEACFEAPEGRVYTGFERQRNSSHDIADLGSTLHIGMDFNVDPMTAVLASRAGDELHIHDEIVLENSSTSEMVEAINAFLRRWKLSRAASRGDGRAERRPVIIYPDPSGNQRKTSAVVGQTDFSLLRAAGFSVVAGKTHPAVVDRINEVNTLCLNANGRSRLFLHPRCVNLLRGLEGLTYKEGTSQPDKSTGFDHITDALGYMVHEMFPLGKPMGTTTSTVGMLGV